MLRKISLLCVLALILFSIIGCSAKIDVVKEPVGQISVKNRQDKKDQNPETISRKFFEYLKSGDYQKAYTLHIKKLSSQDVKSGLNSQRLHRGDDDYIDYSEFVTDHKFYFSDSIKKLTIGRSKIYKFKDKKFLSVSFITNNQFEKIDVLMKKQNNKWVVFSFGILHAN